MIHQKYDIDFWKVIKYYYNDDGTRKLYPPRKGKMQGSIYQKSFDDYDSNDWAKHKNLKSRKEIINALAKKSYGLILVENILTIIKTIGGLLVDETKAKTIKKSINLNVLQGKSLDDKISIIENLFI